MTKICEYLYLGNIDDANNAAWLQEHNIRTVISVLYAPNKKTDYVSLEITYHHFPMLDCKQTQDPFVYYDDIKEIISRNINNESPVLIHCHRGVSRSATIVIAYIMEFSQMKFKKALEFVKERRSVVDPNPKFMKYLSCHEELLFGDA